MKRFEEKRRNITDDVELDGEVERCDRTPARVIQSDPKVQTTVPREALNKSIERRCKSV